jgi:hypothetical protein
MPAEGRAYQRGQYPQGFVRVIGNGYFRTMGIPMRAGRDFTDADTRDAPPVLIINESMARTLWPDRSAIGQRIWQGNAFPTVVGVVEDTRHTTLESPFTGEVYFPLGQYFASRVDLVVRVSHLVQLCIRAHGLGDRRWQPKGNGARCRSSSTRLRRRGDSFIVLAGFAVFAVVLAALIAAHLYGVTQRQEIGIRIALGAAAQRAVRSCEMRWVSPWPEQYGIAGAIVVIPAMSRTAVRRDVERSGRLRPSRSSVNLRDE